MISRRWRWSVAVLTAGPLLAGCGTLEDGPLESVDDSGVTVCAPQEAVTGRTVIAISGFQVVGDQDVTVTGASLVDAEGLELNGYDFGDFEDRTFQGVGLDYATDGPSDDPTSTLTAGHSYTVKVGLAADPEGGYAAAVAIDYTVGRPAHTYTVQTLVEMRVAARGAVCSS